MSSNVLTLTSPSSQTWLPVYVEGANISIGDLHFSQGDGELSFCGAIEMAGNVTLRCSVVKGGVEKMALKQPIFLVRPFLSLRRFPLCRPNSRFRYSPLLSTPCTVST